MADRAFAVEEQPYLQFLDKVTGTQVDLANAIRESKKAAILKYGRPTQNGKQVAIKTAESRGMVFVEFGNKPQVHLSIPIKPTGHSNRDYHNTIHISEGKEGEAGKHRQYYRFSDLARVYPGARTVPTLRSPTNPPIVFEEDTLPPGEPVVTGEVPPARAKSGEGYPSIDTATKMGWTPPPGGEGKGTGAAAAVASAAAAAAAPLGDGPPVIPLIERRRLDDLWARYTRNGRDVDLDNLYEYIRYLAERGNRNAGSLLPLLAAVRQSPTKQTISTVESVIKGPGFQLYGGISKRRKTFRKGQSKRKGTVRRRGTMGRARGGRRTRRASFK